MTKHPFGELTRGEKELLRAAKAGEVAVLIDFSDEDREVRPELIRWLCERSGNRKIVAAHGVRLGGARISGVIDLSNLDIQTPLWLRHCEVGRFHIRARVREISLEKSTFEDGIDAQGVMASRWSMDGAKVEGQLNLSNAVLEGQFSANNAQFTTNGDGLAIFAQGVRALGWFMDGARVNGQLNIADAVLGGVFGANKSHFMGDSGGVAIFAQDVRGTGWFMEDTKVSGQLNLSGAVLEGQFSANNGQFSVEGKALAIFAQGVKVTDWFMDGVKMDGQLNLSGAVLEGQFSANGAWFAAKGAGTAIIAQDIRAAGWLMHGKCEVDGRIDLNSAEIGHLDFSNSTVDSRSGVAVSLTAACFDVVQTRIGFSVLGAFVCDGAKITGVLRLGSALLYAHASSDTDSRDSSFVNRAFSAVEAEIGRLILPEQIGSFCNPSLVGIIDLSRARIGTLVDYGTGWYPQLEEAKPIWERTGTEPIHDAQGLRHIMLDGTHYDFLKNPDGNRVNVGPEAIWKSRVRWLRSQHADALTGRFNPQPWRQLARTLTIMGYEEDARQIAIQRRVAERRAERNCLRKGENWILHQLADYGFNPWRTVGWCFVFGAIFGGLYGLVSGCWWDCAAGVGMLQFGDFFATLPGDVLDDGQAVYPAFNPWLYSFDQFIPILDLGMDGFWRPKSLGWYFLSVCEQVIGAFMVALMVTGFTGLLTRDEAV